MRCKDLTTQIEALAAGESAASGEAAAHLASCAACAAELDLACRIEHLCGAQQAPVAPPHFASAVMRRVRRERWRSEQYVDLGFNAAILVSVVFIVGGIWLALNATGLAAVASGTVQIFSSGLHELAQRAAPRLPVYSGAVLLVLSALAVWWWAERGWSV